MMEQRWVVTWGFTKRPRRTFYEILADEFGLGEVERVQRSVVVCQNDFVARRVRALARFYGGDVVAFAINGASLDDAEGDRDTEKFVARIHSQRLARRGRRPVS